MANRLSEPAELMTVAEVAMELRCSASSVRRWLAEGHLVATKLHPGRPGAVRIRRSDVDALLERPRA